MYPTTNGEALFAPETEAVATAPELATTNANATAEVAPSSNAELDDLINRGRLKESNLPATAPEEAEKKDKVEIPQTLAGQTQGKIAEYLMRVMKDRLAQVLDKTMTPERVAQMAAMTISKNPALAECSTLSLMGAVMQASILGFPPVDSLGYCYFVPYANSKAGVKEVQFQIGYKGLIDLARRSGRLRDISAEVVYEGDIFEVSYGLERNLTHIPRFEHSGKPDKIEFVYAVALLADGGKNFVVLPRVEIERLRQRSPGQRAVPTGAWQTDYEAMAKAKALKQLSKFLPLNLDDLVGISKDETIQKVDLTGKPTEEYTPYTEVPNE